ncbi:MAG: hypothetical protein WCI67_17770 [Chloroflexales bacterium]
MRALHNPGRLIPLIVLGLMGSVFLCIGVVLGTVAARSASAEADRAERLAPASAAALEDSPLGKEILVEGALSARNKPRFRDFVAYTREEYRGSDKDGHAKWSEDERVTPPLLVDLAAGAVQIGNDDYRISGPHATWQEGSTLVWNGLLGEGTKRYRGLVAGRPAMAIGIVRRGAEGAELQAELVFGGTRAAYIAAQRDTARFMPIIGAILGGVGVLLLGIGVRVGLRR